MLLRPGKRLHRRPGHVAIVAETRGQSVCQTSYLKWRMIKPAKEATMPDLNVCDHDRMVVRRRAACGDARGAHPRYGTSRRRAAKRSAAPGVAGGGGVAQPTRRLADGARS